MFFRLFDRLLDALGFIVALLGLLLTLGVTLDVAVRAFRIGEIPWMLEASEYALLLITFFGAPWALRAGAHVRVDVVLNALSKKGLRACEIAADLLGLAASFVLLIWSWRAIAGSRATGSMIYKEIIIPEWWLYAIIVFSAALLSIEFVRRLGRAWSGEVVLEPRPEVI